MLHNRGALAERIREVSHAVAVEVTELFLARHPEWHERYGSRAMTAGIQDAGYHLAFLATALEADDLSAFEQYARWTARVLAARGIQPPFLAENLGQVGDALTRRLPDEATRIRQYVDAARQALATSDETSAVTLGLTASVFLQALLAGERRGALQVAREAMREGLSVYDLYVDVFQAALYEVGARWEANRLTVAQEHMATAITQYVMAQIYEAPPPRGDAANSILIAGVEGELHNIGAVMVADVLELSGWRVRLLGSNVPQGSVLASLRDVRPSHLGLSVTMLFNLTSARSLIAAVREEFGTAIRVVVGGAAFRTNPTLWQQVEADAFSADLRGVLSVANVSRS